MKREWATCGAAMLCAVGSATAHELQFRALLAGPTLPGTGTALVMMDLDEVNMVVQSKFDGLLSPVSSAAIHGRTAIEQTGTAPAAIPLPEFPAGMTSGISDELIDLTQDASYTQEYIDASGDTGQALTNLVFGLVQGRMYLNIKSTAHPDGDISGFFTIWPDSNESGAIDTPDFVAVASHFNQFGTDFHSGDFNIDGFTNALDFNAVATNFGQSIDLAAPGLPVLVPEPTAALALFVSSLIARRAKLAKIVR